MKQLKEIFVNKIQLKLIIGIDIGFKFPKNQKTKRSIKVSLQQVLGEEQNVWRWGEQNKGENVANIRSFDGRFDKKHPLVLALEYIQTKGLKKDIWFKIITDSGCIRMGKMVGQYDVFNDLLNDQQKKEVEDRLKLERKRKDEMKERFKTFGG